MGEPATVQHALARFLDPGGLDGQRRRVCSHLLGCRTEAMGGVARRCGHCALDAPHWFGCRDRHCPQCQGRAIRQWAERRRADILPVRYYHVVFTLPHTLNAWVQLHPEVIHRLLFASVWATVKAFGRDPKYLGGEMGMSAVLHTWGQNLSQHVHLHCLVPGGALGDDGTWREQPRQLPVPGARAVAALPRAHGRRAARRGRRR
ncbi:MAG: transposase zinc-binding domain-containing protein [Halofilum sp. (in: g-proteobacteria)]|nr:transposase zinc-binding domain-containing protein [Halofilum sp. (in: g-proteobacteria)]